MTPWRLKKELPIDPLEEEAHPRFFTSLNVWRITTVTAIFVASIAIFLSAYLFTVQASNSAHIRDDLIHSCLIAGDPQKQAVIEMIQGQISQSHAFDAEQLFPSVPRRELHQLISEANKSRRLLLNQLEGIPSCEDRFK